MPYHSKCQLQDGFQACEASCCPSEAEKHPEGSCQGQSQGEAKGKRLKVLPNFGGVCRPVLSIDTAKYAGSRSQVCRG